MTWCSMSATRIARSPALQRLRNEGYHLDIRDGVQGALLLVHDVPYVNPGREVGRGTLVMPLELSADVAAAPVGNHQAWFIGEHPCNQDGSAIVEIKHSTERKDFGEGVLTNHGFSAKPRNGIPYADYHAKVSTYCNIIQAPAQQLEPGVSAKTFPPYFEDGDSSVFKYADSATSRSGIGPMSAKLALRRIAIIGLGGTGSYVLDLVAKTHVREIHLFDDDVFHQHSAFRAPGAPAFEDLTNPLKVHYYHNIYSRMRHGIFAHPERVTRDNVDQLAGFDFVFVCIDKPTAREPIFAELSRLGVPFIDAGIDVQKFREESLFGLCRVTLSTPEKNDHLADYVSFTDGRINDLYASDIQVADLNAMAAVMAVMRWKRLFKFYLDDVREHHNEYTVGTNAMTKAVKT